MAAGSWTFQHKSWRLCLLIRCLPNFITSVFYKLWGQNSPHCLNLCLVLSIFSVRNTDSDSCDSDGNEGNISEEDQAKSQSDHEDR